MIKNKKVLVLLIFIISVFIIGISTILITNLVNFSPGNTQIEEEEIEDDNDNDFEEDNSNNENIEEFSINYNGIKYLSGTINNIDLDFGVLNEFKINGVESYTDYEFDIVLYLPNPNYFYYFTVSYDGLVKTGNENIPYMTYNGKRIVSVGAVPDYSKGFSIIQNNNFLSICLNYDNIDSFLDNYFGENTESFDSHKIEYPSIELNSLLGLSYFKLNIRKISTDELVSLVLCFK